MNSKSLYIVERYGDGQWWPLYGEENGVSRTMKSARYWLNVIRAEEPRRWYRVAKWERTVRPALGSGEGGER